MADPAPRVPLVIPRRRAAETDLAAKEVIVLAGRRYVSAATWSSAARRREPARQCWPRLRRQTDAGRQGAGRQQRLSPLPEDPEAAALHHRCARIAEADARYDGRLRPAHQHQLTAAERDAAIPRSCWWWRQAFSFGQGPTGHAADLPPNRRGDPRPRVLQLPRSGVAQGTGWTGWQPPLG